MIVLTLLEYVGGGNVVVQTGESRWLSAGRIDVATKRTNLGIAETYKLHTCGLIARYY
jgi:hypothetical protein